MRATKAGLALVLLAAVAAWSSPPAGIEGPLLAPTQVADQPRVLITEVMFAPASGDTGFVELANVGDTPVDLTSMVLRIDTLVLPLPRLAAPFAPGGRVLVRFDSRGTIEGNVVHASPGFTLNPDGGVVHLLRNDDFVLDRVAWGTGDGAIAPSIGGLAAPQVELGTSLGRPPDANHPGASSDWVFYPPDQVTPGRPNAMPSVVQLLPLDGAILEGSSAALSWYLVPGAGSYRVQLSRDTTFAQTLVNQVTASPPVSTGQLPAGVYWWRVQAMPADGPAAAWSQPARIELGSPSGGGGSGPGGGGGGPSDDGSIGEGSGAGAPRLLNVLLLSQHKDSKMLHLEAQQEGSRRTAPVLPRIPHAWDTDHGTLDPKDPVDNMNCSLAGLAMINRYYGGDLSQDRIGYEVLSRNVANYRAAMQSPAGRSFFTGAGRYANSRDLRELQPGPEGDLHFGQGMPWARIGAAALFTLGELPGAGSGWLSPDGRLTRDELWGTITKEIDAGRPLLGVVPGHVIVIRGYELLGSRRLVFVNDPWAGRYALELDVGASTPRGKTLVSIWTFPEHPVIGRQEVSVSTDGDRDGVVDFDEINRFRTNPNNKDSDADGVPDKEDIASGIYENEFGWGYAWDPVPNGPGRDYDHDGFPTELDRDSDNGGCTDGDEDANGDGERTGTETGNFDQTDDFCRNLQGNLSYLIDAVNTDPNQLIKHIHDQGVILVRLKPESPGSDYYVDNGSTFSYRGFARIELKLGGCTLWGREESHASGPFTVDADIGATRGNDGTLALGAHADLPAQTASAGCGVPPGTGEAQRTLNFPDCKGALAPPRAGPPGVRTYRFDCTTPLSLGPGWTTTRFYARGFVRVQ